jgi:LAS superfamily LD-carboxypeptidase LdcB
MSAQDPASLPDALRLDALQLTGRSRSHVVDLDTPACTLHRAAVEPFLAMRRAAAAEGIDLVPASSFRDFSRQVTIWNAKYRGERTLLGRDGLPLDYAAIERSARVDTILWWSALPGASRHHWGSDLDVIDAAAVPVDYRVQLVPQEFAPEGVFARLDAWLADNLERFGFFRPYASDRGGVQPEPWHLSYAPVAVPALAALTVDVLREALSHEPLDGLDDVAAQLTYIHERYVTRVDEPTATLARVNPPAAGTRTS